jgi:hypothetical protein
LCGEKTKQLKFRRITLCRISFICIVSIQKLAVKDTADTLMYVSYLDLYLETSTNEV